MAHQHARGVLCRNADHFGYLCADPGLLLEAAAAWRGLARNCCHVRTRLWHERLLQRARGVGLHSRACALVDPDKYPRFNRAHLAIACRSAVRNSSATDPGAREFPSSLSSRVLLVRGKVFVRTHDWSAVRRRAPLFTPFKKSPGSPNRASCNFLFCFAVAPVCLEDASPRRRETRRPNSGQICACGRSAFPDQRNPLRSLAARHWAQQGL